MSSSKNLINLGNEKNNFRNVNFCEIEKKIIKNDMNKVENTYELNIKPEEKMLLFNKPDYEISDLKRKYSDQSTENIFQKPNQSNYLFI